MKENSITNNLVNYSKMQVEEALNEFKTGKNGLSLEEAEERLKYYGKNIIDIKEKNQVFKRLVKAVINPFNLALILVAVLTLVTDVVFAEKPSFATFITLLLIILVSATISFVEEQKSEIEAQKLKKMIQNKIDVIRKGKKQEINIEEAVPGDIVYLSSGDIIPGDVKFIETKDLFVDESTLTGESKNVEKVTVNDNFDDLSSFKNIGFMGTNIVSGSAKAIILTTGPKTYFGSMAKSLSTDKEKSGFEKGIQEISSWLLGFMAIMMPIIFIINTFTKKSWIEALMFSITIGVGLMPEMLPVITTSTLAKGATGMAKKKTIVKRLSAIQSFGEMDVLCTDKTGTLTENRVILEKYIDCNGKEDLRILRHAYLNSYFQTGLKNIMDIAIINRARKEEIYEVKQKYIKEDEIPFDFERRRMSVVIKDESGKRQLITKGAIREMLKICSLVQLDDQVIPLTEERIKTIENMYEDLGEQGLRVIAVAQKNEIHGIETFGVQDEKDMVLIGFVGFLDPAKSSAKPAIEALKKHGVVTKVLTGDSEKVAISVCNELEINTQNYLVRSKIDKLTDEELKKECENCYLFARLSPYQKQRVVKAIQENGHTVGYMGDGINDALPLKQADVGISVDKAVDIAKETADIILLEKDLNVLEEGVISGRKTFTNILKYLKMATSGNFGNMISIVIFSFFLPFLPLLPLHILVQNLLCDFAQIGMPFDNVEDKYILKPKKWNINNLKNIMFRFGFLSTAIDLLSFVVFWYILKYNSIEKAVYFQCAWFMFGIISQTLVIYIMRTDKISIIKNRASKELKTSTLTIAAITLIIGLTSVAYLFNLVPLGLNYIFYLAILLTIYLLSAQSMKNKYIRKNKEWL